MNYTTSKTWVFGNLQTSELPASQPNMEQDITDYSVHKVNPQDSDSRAAEITLALKNSAYFSKNVLHATAHEVDRLWRMDGGDWNDPQVVAALIVGTAQIAWHCAYSNSQECTPQFAVFITVWPRCLRILLPDDSRQFGDVIVWIRYLEALMPLGAQRHRSVKSAFKI